MYLQLIQNTKKTGVTDNPMAVQFAGAKKNSAIINN